MSDSKRVNAYFSGTDKAFIDRSAAALGLSRSAFLARAAESLLPEDDMTAPTEAQLELLRDKYALWERLGREGPLEARDYNARAAEALKALLVGYQVQQAKADALLVGMDAAIKAG